MHELPDATKRFLAAVSGLGFTIEPRVFPDGTRTSGVTTRFSC
jgi:hypothetical protein